METRTARSELEHLQAMEQLRTEHQQSLNREADLRATEQHRLDSFIKELQNNHHAEKELLLKQIAALEEFGSTVGDPQSESDGLPSGASRDGVHTSLAGPGSHHVSYTSPMPFSSAGNVTTSNTIPTSTVITTSTSSVTFSPVTVSGVTSALPTPWTGTTHGTLTGASATTAETRTVGSAPLSCSHSQVVFSCSPFTAVTSFPPASRTPVFGPLSTSGFGLPFTSGFSLSSTLAVLRAPSTAPLLSSPLGGVSTAASVTPGIRLPAITSTGLSPMAATFAPMVFLPVGPTFVSTSPLVSSGVVASSESSMSLHGPTAVVDTFAQLLQMQTDVMAAQVKATA